MTKEELEKRVHDFAVQIYKEGFEEGHDEGYTKGYAHGKKLAENKSLGRYRKGLEDAWECIQKICMEEPFGLTTEELDKIFNSRDISSVVTENTVQGAMQKIKEYEERQKQDERKVDCEVTACYNCVNHNYCDYEYEKKQVDAPDMNDGNIKAGDEVRIKGSDYDCDYGICTRILPFNIMYVMRRDGSSGEEKKDEWYKTGRHFPQIAEVLAEMRGDKA
jgi:hypothetical protein